jgi:hypothetical protein
LDFRCLIATNVGRALVAMFEGRAAADQYPFETSAFEHLEKEVGVDLLGLPKADSVGEPYSATLVRHRVALCAQDDGPNIERC